MTGFENVWVLIREKVWLENSLISKNYHQFTIYTFVCYKQARGFSRASTQNFTQEVLPYIYTDLCEISRYVFSERLRVRPVLLQGEPLAPQISVRLIQSEHFGKEGERYIGDPACGPVIYRQCCCPTCKLMWCWNMKIWNFLFIFCYSLWLLPHVWS